MSTRATYKFEHEDQNIYFYVHHDNYPEGAAIYFLEMHKLLVKSLDNFYEFRGSYAEAFIKSNKMSEFTRDHMAHWDTEYRYSINKNGILTAEHIKKRNFDNPENDIWETFFTGHYAEFINKYIEDKEIKLYETGLKNYPFLTSSEILNHLKKLTTDVVIKGYKQYAADVRKWKEIFKKTNESTWPYI